MVNIKKGRSARGLPLAVDCLYMPPILKLPSVHQQAGRLSFLAQSFAAFSRAQNFMIDHLNIPDGLDLPLWQNASLEKKHSRAYLAPTRKRKGALTIRRLMDQDHRILPRWLPMMGPTWLPLYQTTMQMFQKLMVSDSDHPTVLSLALGKSLSPCDIAR